MGRRHVGEAGMIATVAAEDRATLGSDPSAAATPDGTRGVLKGRRALFAAPADAGGDKAINPGGSGAEPLSSPTQRG